jgi:hypothetical protein
VLWSCRCAVQCQQGEAMHTTPTVRAARGQTMPPGVRNMGRVHSCRHCDQHAVKQTPHLASPIPVDPVLSPWPRGVDMPFPPSVVGPHDLHLTVAPTHRIVWPCAARTVTTCCCGRTALNRNAEKVALAVGLHYLRGQTSEL